MFLAKNLFFTGPGPGPPTTVVFDTSGVDGATGGRSTATVTMTVASGASVLAGYASRSAPTVSSVTAGGSAMTLVNLLGYANSTANGAMALYKIQGVGTGASMSMVLTLSGNANIVWFAASYKNVTSFGSGVTNFGQSVSPSVAVPSSSGHMAFAMFGQSSNSTQTAFTQTQRQNNGGNPGIFCGDAAGAASVSFGGTYSSSSTKWGAIGIDMI